MGTGKNGRLRFFEIFVMSLGSMFIGVVLYDWFGSYLISALKIPVADEIVFGVLSSIVLAQAIYRVQMKLTDEEWEAVKKVREQARKREIREEIKKEQQKNEVNE